MVSCYKKALVMGKRIVYVGFTFPHHKNTHAGYQHIADYLPYDNYVDCQSFYEKTEQPYCEVSWIVKFKRRVFNRLFGFNCFPWYVLKIIWLGLRYNNVVFHYIYGENTYFSWIRHFIRKGNKSVCTLHQPYDFFFTRKRYTNLVKHADGIILVGNTEVDKFKSLSKNQSVWFIPHGIDTEFYNIDAHVTKERMLLTVGNWLRDYSFANRIYMKLLEEDNSLNIYVVTNSQNKEKLSKHDRIHILSGIDDEELKKLYQRCSVLFLPLIRYTANNSLLEAGATGCNIVVSSDYPDNSYLPESLLTLTSMEEDKAINGIEKTMTPTYNAEISEYVSRKYGWEHISKQTFEILSSI